MTTRRRQTAFHTFAWPIVIGVLSLGGLVAGLTGDGLPDLAAAALLGSTIIAILYAYSRASRPASPSNRLQRRKPPK